MLESRTVGWDSSRGEFQFISDEPGPLLLVTPDQLAAGFQQRDGTWLLRGYTDTEHDHWCEFVIRSPVLHLARSLLPANHTASPGAQVALEEPSEPRLDKVGWQPAPPQPATASDSPVSFYQPRSDPVERVDVVDLNTEVTPPPAPELYDLTERPTSTAQYGDEVWIVRYVQTDPRVPDESKEREFEVQTDSDAAALRALHSEMRRKFDEPAYRVLSVVPARAQALAG